jgi:hypothetical protein
MRSNSSLAKSSASTNAQADAAAVSSKRDLAVQNAFKKAAMQIP